MNALGDDVRNHFCVPIHTCVDSVNDGGAPCDKNRLDNGSGANSNDPNKGMDLCNGKDATNLANIPNSMENANTPKMGPKTNHILLGDIYILAL